MTASRTVLDLSRATNKPDDGLLDPRRGVSIPDTLAIWDKAVDAALLVWEGRIFA